MKMRINMSSLYLALTMVLFYVIHIFGQESAQISIPFQIYDNAGGQKTLYFGVDQTATDSIDIHLDESDLPPFPPTGVFDGRWLLPKNGFNGSLSSWSDYRFAAGFPFSGTLEHRLKYQSAEGATIMYFSWNFPPEVTGLLQDLVNGALVNVPLSGSGVYELANFLVLNQLKLLIYYNNIVTGIKDEDIKPGSFKLEQNFPNPFNPSTVIKYDLPEMRNVTLAIYNALGEKVRTLVSGVQSAGYYSVLWDAKNDSGNKIGSGMYIYSLRAGDYNSVKKMILLK